MNQVQLDGKIVSDIKIGSTKRNIPVLNFRLIHKDSRAKNPLFVDIEVWGKEAEALAEEAKRGDVVRIIEGELRRDQWESREKFDDDGQLLEAAGLPRSKLKITASVVEVLQKKAVYEEESQF